MAGIQTLIEMARIDWRTLSYGTNQEATMKQLELFVPHARPSAENIASKFLKRELMGPLVPKFILRTDEAMKGPCIYFLCQGEEIVYIGQTVNLLSRVANHIAGNERGPGERNKLFTNVKWAPVPRINLLDVEDFWIQKLRPKYNRTIRRHSE